MVACREAVQNILTRCVGIVVFYMQGEVINDIDAIEATC